MTFIGVQHIAPEAYWAEVTRIIRTEKERGATLYYEGIDLTFNGTEEDRQTVAKLKELFIPVFGTELMNAYAELSDASNKLLGRTDIRTQKATDFLRVVNNKDVWADMTYNELIPVYEQLRGPIRTGVSQDEAERRLLSFVATTEPIRSSFAARKVHLGSGNAVVIYGNKHAPEFVKELLRFNPAMKVTARCQKGVCRVATH